jgi:tetratricopeptide (TPR) repeat protein
VDRAFASLLLAVLALTPLAAALDRDALDRIREESSAARDAEMRGNEVQEILHLERAAALARERLPGTIHEANAVDALAFAFLRAGRYAEAIPLYVESLDRYRSLLRGDQPRIATSLHNLAVVEWRAGRAEAARRHAAEAVLLWDRLPSGRATGRADTVRLLEHLATGSEPPDPVR